MSDAFSGNLAQFKLLDILRLLQLSNRTGLLELSNDESGQFAEVYFLNGQLIHAFYEDYLGEDAVYALFSWSDGFFRFRANEETDEQNVTMGTSEVLNRSVAYAADWESVRRVIPSRNTTFRLSSRPSKEFSLRSEDWAILREVDGERNVAEIADATQMSELDASRILVRLFDLGLIELAERTMDDTPAVEVVEEKILRQVEKELMVAIGPMAPIVLDDCAEMMGHRREDLPRDMVPAFLEQLAQEIPDSERRIRFQESMLEIMKQLF